MNRLLQRFPQRCGRLFGTAVRQGRWHSPVLHASALDHVVISGRGSKPLIRATGKGLNGCVDGQRILRRSIC